MNIYVDRRRSVLVVEDRWWPACALICPNYDDQHDGDGDRMLGDGFGGTNPLADGSGTQWDVYVMCENGLLAEVTVYLDTKNVRLDLRLNVRKTVLVHQNEESIWLPATVRPERINGKDFLVWGESFSGWDHADPEWVNETIERLSRRHIVDVSIPGPPCKMVSLSKAAEIHQHWVEHVLVPRRRQMGLS